MSAVFKLLVVLASGNKRFHAISLLFLGALTLSVYVQASETKVVQAGKRVVSSADSNRLDPIALREPVAGANTEIWDEYGSYRTLRNVINPTLTPVLPVPEKATGAAVIVAPGGAFLSLSMDSEGFDVAQWLADKGIAAFVLKYRLRETPIDAGAYNKMVYDTVTQYVNDSGVFSDQQVEPLAPTAEALEDAVAAVRLIRQRAGEWGVDPQRVGIVGFSAGAITALGVGLIEDDTARPDFIAPIYPPMMARPVPAYAPPMFVAIALDDRVFADHKPFGLIESWRRAERPVEAHFYERGGHGFGMSGVNAATAQWGQQFYGWMQDRGIISGHVKQKFEATSGWSVESTSIGDLVDNSATKAILDKHLPDFSESQHVTLMRSSTLVAIQAHMVDLLTDEKLQAIQSDLNSVPGN